ncbi:MAG: hypothetical protein AAGI07_08245, partial [Bacteroidota bacterium]
MMKNSILKIHLTLVVLMLFSFAAKMIFGIGIESRLDTIVKILIVLSGLGLFLMNLKPFKKINLYFSIYPLYVSILIVAFIFQGILGGIIVSIMLSPMHLNKMEHREDKIIIYDNAKGFMSMCCSYKVTENKFFIFEKDLGEFKNDGVIDFKNSKMNRQTNSIELTFSYRYYDEDLKKYSIRDKTIKIKTT